MGVCARATSAPPQRRAHQRARRARSPPLPLLSPPPVYHHHLNIPQLRALCLPLRFPFARLLLSQKVSLAGSTPARARGRPAHLTNCTTTITGGSGSRPYPSTTPMHAHTHTLPYPACDACARPARSPPGWRGCDSLKTMGRLFPSVRPHYSTLLYYTPPFDRRFGERGTAAPGAAPFCPLPRNVCCVVNSSPPFSSCFFNACQQAERPQPRPLSCFALCTPPPYTKQTCPQPHGPLSCFWPRVRSLDRAARLHLSPHYFPHTHTRR